MKFGFRLGISIVSIIFIGFLSISYLSYSTIARMMEEEIRQRAEEGAFNILDRIERFMFERLQDSKIVASTVSFKDEPLDLKIITRRLIDYRNLWRCYTSLSFYDLNGRRIADTSGLLIGKIEKDRLFFKEAMEKGISSGSEVGLSTSQKIPIIYFSCAVKGRTGQTIGVVVSRVPFYKLRELLAEITAAQSSQKPFALDLINNGGKIIYSTRKSIRLLEEGLPESSILKELKMGKKYGFTPLHRNYKGTESHFNVFAVERGYLDYKGNGWALVLEVPEEYISVPLAELRRKTLSVFFFVLIFASVISVVLSQQISKPISHISEAVQDIGRGRLDVEIKYKPRDELGRLVGVFNTMAKDLKSSRQKLEDYAGNLEREVKERTAQLEEARRGLEVKVGERTKELHEKYSELEKAQTAMLSMVEDLNRQADELKNAQDALVRSERLAAIGQLASSVAHELRNPLGVMKNVLYYFNMLELGKDNREVKENLDTLAKEIDISDKIIGDLLEFSRVKKPTLLTENINAIVKEALNRLKAAPDIKVITELDNDLPSIEVDALQIQQVFYNIALNALQAMDKTGTLTVKTYSKGNFIEASFTDTGYGIPKENMDKIFNPLFSTKAKGTGLGLSVCASLVEGHDGKIEVGSEIGKGSTFTVQLPVKRG